MSDVDVVVVGGGPAGILAAGKAAADGATVLLLEKMEKPARKLRITGKGRCNITNTKPYNEFINDIFPDPRFVRDAFNAFFSQDIVQLLNERGVATVEERGMRIFPTSGKAWDVAEALIGWAKANGVKTLNHARVIDVETADDAIVAISYADKNGNRVKIGCKSVILATGGKSYPATGSMGEGYELASKLKHTVTPLLPSLVGVETKPCYKFSRNLSLRNVNLAVYIEGKRTDEEFGEMEITPYGFNGPIVLRLSRKIVFALAKGSSVELELDLKPALSHDKLDARILREIDENPRIAVADLASRLLPRDLAMEMIDELGLAAQKNLGRLTADERESIRHWIKEQRFVVINQRSWPEAIITAGGISLKEVNQKTMGSKKVDGLYFAGELLDLDGSTGGYNLQIAYSTGWLAGKSAAEYVATKQQ